jgi:hypothetical protein
VSTVPNPAQPSPFALAAAAAVVSLIEDAGWTVEAVVERAESIRDMTASGHVAGLGDVNPRPLEPGLAGRLRGDGVLNFDDLEIVGFVLGEDAAPFAVGVISTATLNG